MVHTGAMGFEVTVVAMLPSSPKGHAIDELEHHFEVVQHPPGSKAVTISEHVSMNDESDAIAFVRALVIEALPQGSKVTEVTAVADE
jgi:hypothetical protein